MVQTKSIAEINKTANKKDKIKVEETRLYRDYPSDNPDWEFSGIARASFQSNGQMTLGFFLFYCRFVNFTSNFNNEQQWNGLKFSGFDAPNWIEIVFCG